MFFLVISILLNVVLGWVVFNLLRKIESLEEFFEAMQRQLQLVLEQIRIVDIRGSFEADDEVGFVFKGIQGMVETLDRFTVRNDGNGNTQAEK
jgi:regulatory protein YycI of two-component signal transduction system YycFG